MTETLLSLGGLFLAALGAATILPFQSEVVLVGLIAAAHVPVWLLIVVASVGNTLGSLINWLLGLGIERFRHRRWFPATEAQLARAQDWYRRWGVWSLLISWAPFTDVLTLVAGIMRTPIWVFLPIVAVAKTGRYIVVAWATQQML